MVSFFMGQTLDGRQSDVLRKFCAHCNAVLPIDHQHRAPDTRPSSAQRGYDAEWRKTRAAFLATHPICEDEAGCIEPATDVDHIDGSGPLGNNDWSNLRALCHSHHSKKTYRSEGGGFR